LGLLQYTLPGQGLLSAATMKGLTALASPQDTGAADSAFSAGEGTISSAITVAAPTKVTTAMIHNVLMAVFICSLLFLVLPNQKSPS
jgi:hypothetical protein